MGHFQNCEEAFEKKKKVKLGQHAKPRAVLSKLDSLKYWPTYLYLRPTEVHNSFWNRCCKSFYRLGEISACHHSLSNCVPTFVCVCVPTFLSQKVEAQES